MSPSAFMEAEDQWLAQMRTMRDALAELKQSHNISAGKDAETLQYGQDIILDGLDCSEPSWTDDLWESELERETDTDFDDGVDVARGTDGGAFNNGVGGSSFGSSWLSAKCVNFAEHNPGLDATELQEQIMAILASDSDGDCDQQSFRSILLTKHVRSRLAVSAHRYPWI